MISSKIFIISLKYNITTTNKYEYEETCEQLKDTLTLLFESNEFVESVNLLSTTNTVELTDCTMPTVNVIITLYTTCNKVLRKDIRMFVDKHAAKFTTNDIDAVLIKRRVY